jgi:CspA family cold shock protein
MRKLAAIAAAGLAAFATCAGAEVARMTGIVKYFEGHWGVITSEDDPRWNLFFVCSAWKGGPQPPRAGQAVAYDLVLLGGRNFEVQSITVPGAAPAPIECPPPPPPPPPATGRVKSYDAGKGHGFLAPDGGGEDLFIHYTRVVPGRYVLQIGEKVSYNVMRGPQGLVAIDIQSIGPPPAAAPAPAAAEDLSGRHSGKVKYFDQAKGYGYITPDVAGADVFVHFSAIAPGMSGYKSLNVGQKVTYELQKGPKGIQAQNVRW